jgi:hypothetical protein
MRFRVNQRLPFPPYLWQDPMPLDEQARVALENLGYHYLVDFLLTQIFEKQPGIPESWEVELL